MTTRQQDHKTTIPQDHTIQTMETFLDCYQQWCDENEYELYKVNQKDKTLEKVTLSELRTLFTETSPCIDTIISQFFDYWVIHHWTMMKWSTSQGLIPELFDIHDFENELRILYRNKTTLETCIGCLEDQPNQLAHMGPGGCLHHHDSDDNEFV
jgi:hypothetical protein